MELAEACMHGSFTHFTDRSSLMNWITKNSSNHVELNYFSFELQINSRLNKKAKIKFSVTENGNAIDLRRITEAS